MNNIVKFGNQNKDVLKLDIVEATELINKLAYDSGNIFLKKHARKRMQERDFIFDEVLQILREGTINKEPEYDNKKGSWKYKVEFYKFNNNRDAACVVSLDKKKKVFVITVMWLDFK
jgi:hypothetical protein